MSCNVDSVNVIKLDAWMFAKDVLVLLDRIDDEEILTPECCFLNEMHKKAKTALRKNDLESKIALPNFWWCGECSGSAMDDLKNEIAPLIHGTVEAVFMWEGGCPPEGLVIREGKMVSCKVDIRIVEDEPYKTK